MKKIGIAAVALAIAFVNGCGNMDIVDWHWTFDRARIKVGEGKWEEFPITRWHDYGGSDMIAIETKDRVCVTHSANVILIKTKNGE